MSDQNVLGQKKIIVLPIGETEFEFTFTRQQVYELMENAARGDMSYDTIHNTLVRHVKDEQKQELLSIINAPENMTIIDDIFTEIVPLLKKNKISLGKPKIKS
jgi:hypothetical protein